MHTGGAWVGWEVALIGAGALRWGRGWQRGPSVYLRHSQILAGELHDHVVAHAKSARDNQGSG